MVTFTTVPHQLGLCRRLRPIVLLSESVTELHDEVGWLHNPQQVFLNGMLLKSLPESVGTLPLLKEMCVGQARVDIVALKFGTSDRLFELGEAYVAEKDSAKARFQVLGEQAKITGVPVDGMRRKMNDKLSQRQPWK